MKTIAIAASAFLFFASPVASQDWSGWHAGANVGFAYSETWSGSDGTSFKSGASVGLTLGHWWQLDPYYLGMDVGLSFGGASGNRGSAPGDPGMAWRASMQDHMTASLRAKVGAPIGPALAYAAIGVEHVRAVDTHTWMGWAPTHSDKTETKPTAALGINLPLHAGLSFNAEMSLSSAVYDGGDRRTTSVRGLAGLTKHFN